MAHRAHQIGHEHESTFEHADEVDLLVCRIVALNLSGQGFDARLDRFGIQQDVHRTAAFTVSASARASLNTRGSSSVRTFRSRIRMRPFTMVVLTSSPRVT